MFTSEERHLIKLFGKMVFTNPFSEQRTLLEKDILGKRFKSMYLSWHNIDGELSVNKNLTLINDFCDQIVKKGLSGNISTEGAEFLDDWDFMALYWLFAKYSRDMSRNVYMGEKAEQETAQLYTQFEKDYNKVMCFDGRQTATMYAPQNIFALFHQIHRAFNYIFDFIAGGGSAATLMRSSVWQSIFTSDLRRYYRQMFSKMNEITTLITGESGTGKELVARAISFSQFIPFNPHAKRFDESYRNCFHPVLLSAMPQSLVESELFGHAKGAYTGAIEEAHGFFETCQPCGCIFLDEIGDVTMETQVKLLRLLQTRQFTRIGDTNTLHFKGKVIAATHADLTKCCQEGTFRQDLLFRICSDTIQTAPLRTLIDGQEDELRQFIIILAKRVLDGEDAMQFAKQSGDWIIKNLGLDYQWPGNVRELEQCLRNLLIRGDYTPVGRPAPTAVSPLRSYLRDCNLTANELLSEYVTAIYQKAGNNLSAAAEITSLDRRTVKKYLKGNQ